jgi:hypothetical protein
MNNRSSVLPLGFGLSAVLCFSSGAAAEEVPPRRSRTPARVYTNEDLARVHPFRSDTGVDSVPSTPTPAREREPRAATRGGSRPKGEEYWRHEALRFRERMRALVDERETLSARIAAREDQERQGARGRRGSTQGSASGTNDTTATLRARLAAVERRMRALEDDLADRARREGALPGWLR